MIITVFVIALPFWYKKPEKKHLSFNVPAITPVTPSLNYDEDNAPELSLYMSILSE